MDIIYTLPQKKTSLLRVQRGAQIIGRDPFRQVHHGELSGATATLSAEDLTEKVLGWRFPLDGMQHWVKGKLQPGEPIRRISPKDRLGRLTYFEQNGWKVTYDAYKDDTLLPRKMSLEFEKMKLKFVVDKWKQI